MSQAATPEHQPPHLVAIGPILGGVVAAVVVLLSERWGLLGAAVFAGLGSIAGWALQTLFTGRNVGLAALLALLSLAGGVVAWNVLPESSTEAGSPTPTSTEPLAIPNSTMSFTAVSAEQLPSDPSGDVGLAKVRYGAPERLAISYMFYDSDPDRYPLTIMAFTGATALALVEDEWEWFAAGNSGDLHTEAMTVGEVHCALHDQETGLTRAECWRWDGRLAVAVSGITFPTSSERYLASGMEDLFAQIAVSY